MRYPQFIFIIILLLAIINMIICIVKYIKDRKIKSLLKKVLLSILILGFSFIWFVPIHIGYKGEAPLCKFRFNIYTYESSDYGGYGNFNDLIFKVTPNEYGTIFFIEKIGGIQEYFGIKPLNEQ